MITVDGKSLDANGIRVAMSHPMVAVIGAEFFLRRARSMGRLFHKTLPVVPPPALRAGF